MSKALIAGVIQVADEKGLNREVIFEAIEAALVSAYKRNYGSIANVTSEIDRTSGEMRVFSEQEVVEEVMNARTEITLEDARKLHPDAQLGDVVRVQNQPANFGRIAAQTAKQVILQRIREAERDTVYENFAQRVGEVINAQVRSTDVNSGAVTVMLDEKHEALLLRDEQIPNERLRPRDYVRVYVGDVSKSTRGPVIKLSRTHRNLLRRLMEQEIPEVREGAVEIKAIAREPGARSKAAVVATVPGVDPVGSCVGMRGLRIQNIVNELAGEKIDVVEWSADIPTYIANSLSPAKVNSVILDESSSIKTAIVVVPDRQLSLAIGKEGQNARLAAKLTGWRIDIKSESEAMKEGLDRLAAEQAKISRGGDLFDVVERFLQQEDKGEREDLLSRAAQTLESMKGEQSDEERSEFPSVAELPELSSGERESYRDLWPAEEPPDVPAGEGIESAYSDDERVTAEDGADKGADDEDETRPEDADALDRFERARQALSGMHEDFPLSEEPPTLDAGADDAGDTEQEEDAMTRIDALPQVITADMLRARKNKMDISRADFEVPEELLVGLDDDDLPIDEDEDEDEDEGGKAAGKGKKVTAKAKKAKVDPKKGKPKRRRTGSEDSYF
ncbi:MAG: transcription termination factor NusA [Litorilinea sp.]